MNCVRVTLDYLKYYMEHKVDVDNKLVGYDPIISKSEDLLNETVGKTGKNIIKFLDGNYIALKVRKLKRKN